MQKRQEGGEMNMNTNTNKPQAQQPQKCPRCDSLNTKFCYYNNYSLSQPRYFCKTCRRYWTQGGTLRNVRVGGGCRKAKRSKSSATPSSSSADQPIQPPQEPAVQKDPSSAVASAAAAAAMVASPAISPFYHGGAGGSGGGYLSSLAAIQSLNPPQPFNQMGISSNLSLLSGFGVPSLGSPIRPSQQFYQMGIIRDKEDDTLYEAEQGLIQSTNWPGSFINDSSHRGSDASLWSSTTVSTNASAGGNSENNINDASAGGSLSLIPNPQWPDLPGFDPPR